MRELNYSEFKFSSAHFYSQEAWPTAKNESQFGKCFFPHGHGHDYKVEVFFEGSLDLFESAKAQILETLDHHHLNFRLDEFKPRSLGGQGLIPTTENLGQYLWSQFFLKAPELRLRRIRLFETADIWAEIEVPHYLLAK